MPGLYGASPTCPSLTFKWFYLVYLSILQCKVRVGGKRSRRDELVTMSYSMKRKSEIWKKDGRKKAKTRGKCAGGVLTNPTPHPYLYL